MSSADHTQLLGPDHVTFVATIKSHLQAGNLVFYHGAEVLYADPAFEDSTFTTTEELVTITATNLSEINQGISIYKPIYLDGQSVPSET